MYHPKKPYWLGIVLLVLIISACGSGDQGDVAELESLGSFDVAVAEIHVTQGVQHADSRFWVPLVAERSIAVRVQVERVHGTPGPVTGKLSAYVNGQEITPPGGIDDLNRTFPPPYNQFLPPAISRFTDLLEREEFTLNFELPADDYPIAPAAGRTVANDVYFRVRIFAQGDADPNNNTGWTRNLTVVRRATPWLFKDRVIFLPNGNPNPNGARPSESFIAPLIGDAMVPAVWPIPDAPTNTGTQTNPIFPPLLPGLTFTYDCNGDGMITSGALCFHPQHGHLLGDEQGLLLARIQSRRQLLVQGGFGPDERVYLYAWVREGNLSGHDGVAAQGANVGYGHAASDDGQYIFAHEFGHMVGLDHNHPGRVLNEWGWDVGARLHQNPVSMVDGITGRVKPPSAYGGAYSDVMNDSPYQRTNNTWIDLESYRALLQHPKLTEPAERNCEDQLGRYETLVVYGIPVGNEFRVTVYRYPWASCLEATLQPARANVMITLNLKDRLSGEHSRLELPIDATMITTLADGEGHVEALGPFAVPISVPRDTELIAVKVEGVENALRPVTLKPSTHTPKVTIASPKPGEPIGPHTEIVWMAEDEDKDSALSYQVAYSTDGGLSFIPLAVDLEETSFTLEATALPKAERGQDLIRIFANDGLNTGYADVGGLSSAD